MVNKHGQVQMDNVKLMQTSMVLCLGCPGENVEKILHSNTALKTLDEADVITAN